MNPVSPIGSALQERFVKYPTRGASLVLLASLLFSSNAFAQPDPDALVLSRWVEGDVETVWTADTSRCRTHTPPSETPSPSRLVVIYPQAPDELERDQLRALISLLSQHPEDLPVELVRYNTHGAPDTPHDNPLTTLNPSVRNEFALCADAMTPGERLDERYMNCLIEVDHRLKNATSHTRASQLTLSTDASPSRVLHAVTQGLSANERLDARTSVVMIGPWTSRSTHALQNNLPEAQYTLLAPLSSQTTSRLTIQVHDGVRETHRTEHTRTSSRAHRVLRAPGNLALLHGDPDSCTLDAVVSSRSVTVTHHTPPRLTQRGKPTHARHGKPNRARKCRKHRRHRRHRRHRHDALFGTLLAWYLTGGCLMLFLWLRRRR